MDDDRYDLIVLGTGTTGRDAAGRAIREHGARVAVVENTRWGGSCPNVACRPTKAYVVAAELLHDIRSHASERGIDVPAPTFHLARTVAWKNSVLRDQDSWFELLGDAGYALFSGTATFVDRHTVRVGDHELRSERILVATGGRTAVPPVAGIDEVDWIDHVSALELTDVPETLLVVGGGPVGLEFAQIFARFGSDVTIVNHGPQIAARADKEAADELQAALEDDGVAVLLNAGVDSFARNGRGVDAVLGSTTATFTHVLLASGRVPNVEQLALDRVGVEVGRSGIAVDDRLRTNVEGIWAAGDVADGPMLTPVGQYQARIAVDDMFGDGSRRADYSVLPTAIFTDPELGGVGLTETEARAQGFEVDVVRHPLSAVTRAQYTRTKRGLYKVVIDRLTRRALGVHVVSRGASDIVGALAVALKLGATVDDLAAVHHVYPSFSEGLKAAAEQARAAVPA